MANENEVIMTIKVEDSTAKKKLKEIKKEAQDVGQEVENQSRGMSENMFFALSNMNMLFAGASKVVGYLGDKLSQATVKAEQLGSTKFFTGLSSGQIQKIKTQLESVGGSFDSFIGAYSKFNEMWSTRGFKPWGKEIYETLARIPNLQWQSATSGRDLLDKTIVALNKMEDVGLRNSFASALGIPEDVLLAYMKGGKAGNEGLFISDDEIKRAEKMNNNIRQTRQEIELISEKLALKYLLPVMEKFSEWQRGLWGWFGETAGVISSDNRSVSEKQSYLIESFKKAGMTEAGARAVVGNLMVESKLDPLAYNEKEGAFGIAQWRDDRLENLKKFAKENNGNYEDLDTQAAFLLNELSQPRYRSLVRMLRSTADTGLATLAFDKEYERSAGTTRAERLEAAGVEASRYLASYNTNYSSSSSVTTNNYYMTLEGHSPADVANILSGANYLSRT